MYCKYCLKFISQADPEFCPHCGQSLKEKKKTAKFFRKRWFWCIIVVLFIGVIALGNSDPAPSQQLHSINDTQNVENNSHSTVVETKTAPVASATIDESVVYNSGGICITTKGIEESIYGTEIKLLVENNSNANISLNCDDFIVNGITMHGYLYIDAAAGKKANGTITLFSDNLEHSGIDQIATIKTHNAYIYNTDAYETISDISFEIKTSISDSYVQEIDDAGSMLYSSGGISVIAKDLRDDFWGGVVTVLVKNDSGRDILVQADNLSVNGYTITALHSDDVCAGTVRFCEIDLLQSELDENEIENITKITFTLDIIDPDTYETIATTNELGVSIY